jgi:hypothetical protein
VVKSSSQPLTHIRNMEVTFPARCGFRPLSCPSVGITVVPASTGLRGSMRILFSFFINKVDPFCDPFVQRDPLFMMSLCLRTRHVTYSNY